MDVNIADFIQKVNRPRNGFPEVKKALMLCDAFKDWPDDCFTLNNYIHAIESFIGSEITKSSVEKKLSNLDCLQYAWQCEALSGLLELCKFDNDIYGLAQAINQWYHEELS